MAIPRTIIRAGVSAVVIGVLLAVAAQPAAASGDPVSHENGLNLHLCSQFGMNHSRIGSSEKGGAFTGFIICWDDFGAAAVDGHVQDTLANSKAARAYLRFQHLDAGGWHWHSAIQVGIAAGGAGDDSDYGAFSNDFEVVQNFQIRACDGPNQTTCDAWR